MYLDKIKFFLKKLKLKGVVLVYILTMCLVPIVPRATSTFLTTYFYMGVVVVTVLFTIVTCRIYNVREYILFLLPFILYEVVVLLDNHSDEVLLAGYQVLLFLLPACLGFYLVTHLFFAEMHAVLLIVMISVTSVTTIIGCINYPEASRTLASTATSQDPMAVLYDWNNIGGYSFVYSVVLLYPFVILAFKMKRLHIIFALLLTGLVYYMVFQAEYTYAMMLLMMSTMLFFVPRDIPVKKYLKTMALIAILVLIFRVAVAAIVTNIGEMVGNQKMVDKINALLLGTDAVDNFDDNRDELYLHSLTMFLQHPLFGSLTGGRKITGGHSFILDNLALYGSIGGALMALMYRGIYLRFIKPLSEKPGYCILVWTFIETLVLSTINTGMWLNNLCLFFPILVCAIYGSDTYINITGNHCISWNIKINPD